MASSTKRNTRLDLASTNLLRKQEDGRSKQKVSMNHKVVTGPNVVRKEPPQPSASSLAATRTQEHTPVALHSPLGHYKANFKLKFGDGELFTVAEKLPSSRDDNNSEVIIKPVLEPDVSDQIKYIQRIRDASFVTALKIFKEDDTSYAVFEFMPFSLSEIAGNPLLDERRVASILGQILLGLKYLDQIGMEHGELTCSNILVRHDGIVKLWGHEHCRPRLSSGQNFRALALVTMELIQGYAEDDGNVGLDDVERWQNTHVLDFLSELDSKPSVDKLLKHPLLRQSSSEKVLIPMLSFVIISASWGWRYPA